MLVLEVYHKLGQLADAERESSEAQRLSENESTYNRACIAAYVVSQRKFFPLGTSSFSSRLKVDWVCQDPDWEIYVSIQNTRKLSKNIDRSNLTKAI